MFSAKMVCLIQKLFGRDDNRPTNEPDPLSSLDDDSAAVHRTRLSEPADDFCDQPNTLDGRSTAKRKQSESNILPENVSLQSHHRSRTISIPASKGITEISSQQGCMGFGKQDDPSTHNLPPFPPAFLSSSSLSWSSLEPLLLSSSEDVLLCNRPPSCGAMGSAEPVCCCDTCLYMLDSNFPFIADQEMTSYSDAYAPCEYFPPPAYSRMTGYAQPLLSLSGVLPTASSYPSNSSAPSYVASESSQTSSAAKRPPLHYEKTQHQTKQRQPLIQNLPPLISISPDGEEGFADAQRFLQHGQHHKPFCEVPPNKTICHVQRQFMNSK